MPTPQRLPIVGGDEGTWGDILRLYLMKEHYDDGTDNTINGGHKNITIRPGSATAGTAPLKFSSGTLLTTPEAGAVEFNNDSLYFTQTTSNTRKQIATYDTTGATGDVYYRDASGYFTRLAVGATNTILTVAGGVPTWSATLAGKTLDNTNTVTLKDTNFTLQDNTDTTKQLQFELSGITTATTRTITIPNVSGTMYVSSGTDVSVADGGTGRSTNTTAYGIIAAGTTATGAMQTIAPGTSGQFLKSGGAAALASFAALQLSDLSDAATVATLTGTQTLTNKTIVLPQLNSISVNTVANTNYLLSSNSGNYPAFSPMPKYLWHDNLRFNRWTGVPTYETYSGGTWSAQTLDRTPFSGKEAQGIVLANGTTVTGARWTWNSGNFSYGYAFWWSIGFPYIGATAPINSITIESSADGSAWTTRHTSTTNANGTPVWFFQSDNGGDPYIRLTITATNSLTIAVTSIKALSSRWGNQGGGSEYELPYDWDNDRNLTLGTTAGARSSGVLNIGSTAPTTAAEGIFFGTDTNLYRSTTNTLKTDDNLIVGTAGTSAGSVVTIDGTQTLTNKTLTSLNIGGVTSVAQNGTIALYNTSDQTTNYERVRHYWSGNVYTIGSESGGTGSLRTVQLNGASSFLNLAASGISMGRSSTSNANIVTHQATLIASSGVQALTNISPVINQTSTAGYTALLVGVTETSTGSGAKLLADFQVGGTSKAKIDNSGVITAAVGTSSGNVVVIDGTQTLTNKTVASPIITNPQIPTSIYDSNWNQVLDLVGIGSAVNHYYITNQSAGNYPTLGVDGSDSNIGIALAPKGSGHVRFYASAGQTPTLDVAGPDTNLNLNLVSKGSGAVQANGVEVVTLSGSQTLTSKTLTNPIINGTITGTGASSTPASNALVKWDSTKNIIANAFASLSEGTAMANGTTTLTVASAQVQAFYGTSTQTVKLPTTSIPEGAHYTIINQDSGILTVQASDGTTIGSYGTGAATFTSGVSSPTTNYHWVASYTAPGVMLQALNSIKIAGTDNTTMTFPNSSGTVATLAASQTLTNKTISGTSNTLTSLPYDLSAVTFGYVSPRAVGTGDFPFGLKLQRACLLTSVTYRCNTADASGNLVVELRKNGVTVSGSAATIAAASQVSGGTATGSWSFSSGDILTVYVTAVGTTPGTGLIADITGVTA